MAAFIRITNALAERHEALWLRSSALLAQARDIAVKKPDAPVSDDVRMIAGGLMRDACTFELRTRQPQPTPEAALRWGGLAAQLSQLLAGLDSYEAAHSAWDSKQKCRVWLTRPRPVPVRRLRPEAELTETGREEALRMRRHIFRKIQADNRKHFLQGFNAGVEAARRASTSNTPLARPEAFPAFPRLMRLD